MAFALVIYTIFTGFMLHGCACFFWDEDCDIIPHAGCTCTGDTDAPHVICSDLNLSGIPQFSSLKKPYVEVFELSGNSFNMVIGNCFGNANVLLLTLTNNRLPLDLSLCTLRLSQKLVITHFKLSNNDIWTVPSIVRDMSNLLVLDLSYNNIIQLKSSEFQGVTSLRRLDLSGNPLQTMEDIFFGMLAIREVSFSFDDNVMATGNVNDAMGSYNMGILKLLVSSFTIVDTNVRSISFLRTFTNLESLKINYCLTDMKVKKGKKSLLRRSRKTIRYVDISHNMLTKFPTRMLNKCRKLEHLDLSFNRIQSMNFNAARYRKLTHLDLSHNMIQVIEPIFTSSSPLKRLDLCHNYISSISPGSFSHITHLDHLDISGNSLTVLPSDAFSQLQKPVIYIGDNPFDCSRHCELKWLVGIIHDQATSGTGPFAWYDVYNAGCVQYPREIFTTFLKLNPELENISCQNNSYNNIV